MIYPGYTDSQPVIGGLSLFVLKKLERLVDGK
jgi:hypothetical protein